MTVAFELIKSWDGFEELKPVWNELLSNSDADTLFLTWHWIDCWRTSLNKPVTPYIIILKEQDDIVGIAPLYTQDYTLFKLIPFKSLCVLADKHIGSEYPNFIVHKKNSTYYRQLLWQYIEEQSDWDFVWITNIAAWKKCGKSLLQTLNNSHSLQYSRPLSFAETDLSSLTIKPSNRRESLLSALSKSLRTNIRQTEKKMVKQGEIKHLFVTEPDDLQVHLRTLFDLHDMRWQQVGTEGSFSRRQPLKDFYINFTPIALANDQLSLQLLLVDGIPYAAQIGYVYNNEFLAIQEGFNPDLIAGSGQVLRFYSLLKCLEMNLTTYDFLGVYTNHKRRWLAAEQQGRQIIIWKNKPKNFFFKFHTVWPTGKHLTLT